MVLSNAERQARYKQRLVDAAAPAWIRKDFDRSFETIETIRWFREFFGRSPIPMSGNLQLFSRHEAESDAMSLLVRMPYPLGEVDAPMMKGWRLAKEDAEDLGYWRREI
jgi:hypothetical protein